MVKSAYSPVISAVYGGNEGGVSDVEADGFSIKDNILYLNGVKADVTVYNAAGQLIKSVSTDSTVDLTKLTVGLYIVKINAAEKSATLKFVK